MPESCEGWLPIEGYEGLYEVSTLGRVRSLARFVPFKNTTTYVRERILKHKLDKYGYERVSLYKAGAGKKNDDQFQVHRLVAKAFIPNPLDLPEVNHKDRCSGHNNMSNLEWMTHAQNQAHAKEIGFRHYSSRKDFGGSSRYARVL